MSLWHKALGFLPHPWLDLEAHSWFTFNLFMAFIVHLSWLIPYKGHMWWFEDSCMALELDKDGLGNTFSCFSPIHGAWSCEVWFTEQRFLFQSPPMVKDSTSIHDTKDLVMVPIYNLNTKDSLVHVCIVVFGRCSWLFKSIGFSYSLRISFPPNNDYALTLIFNAQIIFIIYLS